MRKSVLSGYVLNGRNPLSYLEWGRESGPTIIFLHGLSGYAYNWCSVAEPLAADYRCLSLDLRGHGDSGPSPEGEYTYELFVTDVQALIDGLGIETFALVGHSMGGRTAIAYAGTHPGRASSIVVVDHAPNLPMEAALNIKRSFAAIPPEFDSWQAAIDYLREHSSKALSAEEIAEHAFYVFRPIRGGRATWKLDPFVREEWLKDELPSRATTDVWPELQKITCPMLVVKGEVTYNLTAELCEQMVQYGPDSSWVEIPGTSHFIVDDDPAALVAELAPFLQRTLARQEQRTN
ncbi:MAG TPA: alpha/beta hydrolase [Dehalococcoidia bacterium]|nr:alpha/beta hydrolase [Dehalococcoidia bacterium]